MKYIMSSSPGAGSEQLAVAKVKTAEAISSFQRRTKALVTPSAQRLIVSHLMELPAEAVDSADIDKFLTFAQQESLKRSRNQQRFAMRPRIYPGDLQRSADEYMPIINCKCWPTQ
ncbi:MAG: hypothetical protein AAF697_11600 [Pseudomonadota bacterium]